MELWSSAQSSPQKENLANTSKDPLKMEIEPLPQGAFLHEKFIFCLWLQLQWNSYKCCFLVSMYRYKKKTVRVEILPTKRKRNIKSIILRLIAEQIDTSAKPRKIESFDFTWRQHESFEYNISNRIFFFIKSNLLLTSLFNLNLGGGYFYPLVGSPLIT